MTKAGNEHGRVFEEKGAAPSGNELMKHVSASTILIPGFDCDSVVQMAQSFALILV